MHWTRDREALYDADALKAAIAARKKDGKFAEDQFVKGRYARKQKRRAPESPKPLRNVAVVPEGICASCRKPGEIEPGKAWCKDCCARQTVASRTRIPKQHVTYKDRYERHTGPCVVCGQRVDTTRKIGEGVGTLVHTACRPLLEQAA